MVAGERKKILIPLCTECRKGRTFIGIFYTNTSSKDDKPCEYCGKITAFSIEQESRKT